MRKENNKWFFNGGRGGGKTLRIICGAYAAKIEELKEKNTELKKKNTELKKKYVEILVACRVLKEKIDLMKSPSPVEAMQDCLLTSYKEVNKKQKEKLTEAKKIIRNILYVYQLGKKELDILRIWEEADQFLKEEI